MINCLVEYKNIPHLNQLYAGFQELHNKNIICLEFTEAEDIPELINKPVIKVVLNEQIVVYYDTLDGLNWIDSNESDNISYFLNHFKCHHYFKRSFSSSLDGESNFAVHPLGLNFGVSYNYLGNKSLKNSLLSFLKKQKLIISLFKINTNSLDANQLSHFPDIELNEVKILFSARLWDPGLAKTKESETQRETINSFRIEIVKKLKEMYKDRFLGGIFEDEYSRTVLNKEYLLPFEFTNRDNYISLMKRSTICIATTGLHNSIGWKFGEYVAASRAIITEKLHYEVPGDFKLNKNYLEFNSASQLIKIIDDLLENKDALRKMMFSNFEYYNLNLRPDIMIFNTINNIFRLNNN